MATCKDCIHYRVCDRYKNTEMSYAPLIPCPDFKNKVDFKETVTAHIIGIMAMVGGFIAMLIKNYAGAYGCFGYAFILWVVMTVEAYKKTKERSDT